MSLRNLTIQSVIADGYFYGSVLQSKKIYNFIKGACLFLVINKIGDFLVFRR